MRFGRASRASPRRSERATAGRRHPGAPTGPRKKRIAPPQGIARPVRKAAAKLRSRLRLYFFDDLRFDFLRPPLFAVFFFGTFFPDLRASERPIAIACLRLLTFFPVRPLFSVPFLRFLIARSTFLDAPLEYFLAMRFSPGCGGKIICAAGESSISLTRVPDAAQRVALAKRCAAEPGP